MKYKIMYSCISHIGHRRKINQDNFICNGRFMGDGKELQDFPINGVIDKNETGILGIFDGMGGEECGEIASLLAANEAAKIQLDKKTVEKLLEFCIEANQKIYQYAEDNGIGSMGTTAALLAFDKKNIVLCNIGDTKIFYFSKGILEQISEDHLATEFGTTKPPLFQCLGIPPSELIIDPYVATGVYKNADMYLICSDGLTDMLSQEEIEEILNTVDFQDAASKLLQGALDAGGRDNITIILCKVVREYGSIIQKIREIKKGKNQDGK